MRGHRRGRVKGRGPVELHHRGGIQRLRALPLYLHNGDDQAVGRAVGGADESGQPLGGEQELGGIVSSPALRLRPGGQGLEDVVVVGQAAHVIVRQAGLKSAKGADDDALRGVAKVDDFVEAFGTHPVTTLEHFGLPLS